MGTQTATADSSTTARSTMIVIRMMESVGAGGDVDGSINIVVMDDVGGLSVDTMDTA